MTKIEVTTDFSALPTYLEAVAKASNDGVTAGARVLSDVMRERISRHSVRVQKGTAKSAKIRFTGSAGPTKIRQVTSSPFQPPFVQSGDMHRSIGYSSAEHLVAYAGSTLPAEGGSPHSYPWYLEFGTRYMAPRPWARSSVRLADKKMYRAFVKTTRRSLLQYANSRAGA